MKHPFFLFIVFLFCLESVLFADVFDKPEFVHAVRKYYRIVEQAKLPYENELRKEKNNAQKQGNVQYFNEIDAELKHTLTDTGHNITEYMPKTKALYNAKLQLKQTVDKVQDGFKKYAETLSSELLKAGRTDEARSMNDLVDTGEPPIQLGKPGVNIPQPETAKGKQLLKNLLAENEKPRPGVKQVEIPVIKKKEDNPFAAKLGSEIEQVVRKKFLNIPEARWNKNLVVKPKADCFFGRFTPDGKKFVMNYCNEQVAHVFDMQSGKSTVSFKYPQRMNRLDIHPSGKIVACGSAGGKIVLWNIDNGSLIREIHAHSKDGFIDGLRFSTDGSFIASGSSDNTAAVWDMKTGKERMRFKGHTDIIWAVDVSPDGKLLATCSQDGSVRLWDIVSGKELHCMKGHAKNNIRALSFNPKGAVLASGSSDNTVIFWNVKTGEPIKRIVGSEDEIAALGFSPGGSQLVIGCNHSFHSSVWDIATGMPLYRLPSSDRGTRTALFAPDGKAIVTCSADSVSIWNVPTPNELVQWERDLQKKRETAKEILLKDVLMEDAKVGYTRWRYGGFTSKNGEKHGDSLYAHAPSKYILQLNGKWKTLKTKYGVASWSDFTKTNCIFIIKGDGKELFRSEEVKDSSARSLELNVGNVKSLELIVDPNGVNFGDHGIWFTPMLSR